MPKDISLEEFRRDVLRAVTTEEYDAMPKQRPENEIQRAVLEYLQYHPKVATCWRNNAGMIPTKDGNLVRLSPAGTSDIIGFLKDGRFLAVEVKAGKNKPTRLQKQFIDDVTEAGGLAFVAWSVGDCEEVLND